MNEVSKAKKVSSIPLAFGEWHPDGAHSHVVEGDLTHVEGAPNEANLFLVDGEFGLLKHEDHGPIVFKRGAIVRPTMQEEYDPIKLESRRVLD